MASFNSNELLAAALEQLGKEQGDPSLVAHSMFRNGTHLKGTDDEEPHNMNPVLFVDEYGREIKGSMSAEDASKPGKHTQEAVESGAILDDSNMMDYPTKDDSVSFLKSFVNEDIAGVPYTLPDQQIFYETGGKLHQMPKPIKEDYDMERLIQSMRDRYRV